MEEERIFSDEENVKPQKKRRWIWWVLLCCVIGAGGGALYLFGSGFFQPSYDEKDLRLMTNAQFEDAVFNLSTNEKKSELLKLHTKVGGEIGHLMSAYVASSTFDSSHATKNELIDFWNGIAMSIVGDAERIGWTKESARDMVYWQILKAELMLRMVPSLWEQACTESDCHDLTDDEVFERMKKHETFDFAERDIVFAMQELKTLK